MKITQHLREIRSKNAKNRKFGGSTLIRKVLPKNDLISLINLYKVDKVDGILKGLFNRKNVSRQGFLWDIARNLFDDQKIFILKEILLIDNPTCNLCKYCGDTVEFNLKIKKYNKFCVSCYKSKPWVNKMVSQEDLKIRHGKISDSVKKFATTKYGRQLYENLGRHNSTKMRQYNQTPEGKETIRKNALRQSNTMKSKIANGEFTPNITNSFTHWDAKIILASGEIKKFRSSWEACFYFCNQQLQYEKLRIPYFDGKLNTNRTYIGDFFDNYNNILYEIKPKSFWAQNNNKMQQIISYCLINNMKFIWINENNILEYIDESIFFDENLIQLAKLKNGIKNGKYFIENKIN